MRLPISQKSMTLAQMLVKRPLPLEPRSLYPIQKAKEKDSVDLIQDSLFSIQVQQPWLLLQFDDSNIEEIGEDRVNKILSVSPDENKGKDREEAVKAEIEDNDNANLSITKTMNRLGIVVFWYCSILAFPSLFSSNRDYVVLANSLHYLCDVSAN